MWKGFLTPWDRQYLLLFSSLAFWFIYGTNKILSGRTSRHNIGGKKLPKHILHPDRSHRLAFRSLNAITECFRNAYDTEPCHPFATTGFSTLAHLYIWIVPRIDSKQLTVKGDTIRTIRSWVHCVFLQKFDINYLKDVTAFRTYLDLIYMTTLC